jgi:class 3 adenylate cyclase
MVSGGVDMSASVFVMSDVFGSTALWETHGAAMRPALETHDRLLHGATESAGGNVLQAHWRRNDCRIR